MSEFKDCPRSNYPTAGLFTMFFTFSSMHIFVNIYAEQCEYETVEGENPIEYRD